MNPAIFKAYDIRGIYGKDLDDEAAYLIGRALVVFLSCKKVVVGMDMRDSSVPLKDALIKGITDQGADVADIGLCTTPMCYYSGTRLSADASVMVTASHNPAEWNGMKICRNNAIPLSGDTGIMDIKRLAMAAKFTDPENKGSAVKAEGEAEKYASYIAGLIQGKESQEQGNEYQEQGKGNQEKGKEKQDRQDRQDSQEKQGRRLRVVCDCANAMGALEADTLRKLDVELVMLYDELDGSFPNHEANPLKTETLDELRKIVKKEKADLGIAFDGDADRVGFVDEKGNIISPDLIGALVAEDALAGAAGSKVLYDLRSSMVFDKVVRENDGTPMMCRVGHAFIKAQMRLEDALFAAELSGHYYFRFDIGYYAESSSLAAGRIMNMIRKEKKPLSEIVSRLSIYFHSGEINSKVADKDRVLRKLELEFSDGTISYLDGLKVSYPDWWFNVRASNTEPLLRLNLEAKDKQKMEMMREKLLGIIRG